MRATDLERFDSDITRRLIAEGVRVECCVPLITRERVLGTLNVASFRDSAFPQEDQDLLTQVGAQVAIAVENALAFQEIAELKNKLTEEKLYLEDEIRTEHNFEEIVGESPVLKALLSQLQTVAPTDSTVLITGETGTGKELIARALHNLSTRRDRTFVKINCAAIPTGLLESELFGHEKGAFTGAIAQKLGRFELADKGTLFPRRGCRYSVWSFSPNSCAFCRSRSSNASAARARAAWTCAWWPPQTAILPAWSRMAQFRSDLFYRLNVFPLSVPPLRERPEDIATLVRYFAQRYARRMNRHIETVSAETIAALERYHWPGNIRELENLIERAVILSPSPVLHIPLSELKSNPDGHAAGLPTLAEAERDHILRALEESKWVLGGPKGAAAMLGMKRTTLQSRMQKLGISRPR